MAPLRRTAARLRADHQQKLAALKSKLAAASSERMELLESRWGAPGARGCARGCLCLWGLPVAVSSASRASGTVTCLLCNCRLEAETGLKSELWHKAQALEHQLHSAEQQVEEAAEQLQAADGQLGACPGAARCPCHRAAEGSCAGMRAGHVQPAGCGDARLSICPSLLLAHGVAARRRD